MPSGTDERAMEPAGKTLPSLVIVSGAPGGGKTTLAAILAREIGLPVLGKDAIKETLTGSLGLPESLDAARRLGAASFVLLETIAGWLLTSGTGAILEANYRRGQGEAGLRPLLAGAHGILIHCEAPPQTILERYAARAAAGERHPIHRDADLLAQVGEDLAAGRYEPLDLPIPALRVNTHDGYAPAITTIVRFIRDHSMTA